AMVSGGSPPPELQLIATTTLANQLELIKITPEALSNEDIFKLWMAFQTHYRPTTSYQLSVVLIQETQPFKSNLPVQARNVLALRCRSRDMATLPPTIIGAGELLTIPGRNFVGDAATDTLVAFDGTPPVVPASVQANCVRVTVPAGLQAGVRTVRVV